MVALDLNGKKVKEYSLSILKDQISEWKSVYKKAPGLAVILVGNDPASQVYVKNKQRTCHDIGIDSFEYRLPENTSQDELLSLIDTLNMDNKVHGILLQLPLPKGLNLIVHFSILLRKRC